MPTTIGVVIYKIDEQGGLDGEWTISSSVGREVADPGETRAGPGGKYSVNIWNSEDTRIFTGSLEITPVNTQVYQLNWTGENPEKPGPMASYTGYGILRDCYLAANYWSVSSKSVNPIAAFFRRLFGIKG